MCCLCQLQCESRTGPRPQEVPTPPAESRPQGQGRGVPQRQSPGEANLEFFAKGEGTGQAKAYRELSCFKPLPYLPGRIQIAFLHAQNKLEGAQMPRHLLGKQKGLQFLSTACRASSRESLAKLDLKRVQEGAELPKSQSWRFSAYEAKRLALQKPAALACPVAASVLTSGALPFSRNSAKPDQNSRNAGAETCLINSRETP